MMHINKYVFLLFNREAADEICNYMHHTSTELEKLGQTYAVLINESIPLTQILHRRIIERKSTNLIYIHPIQIIPFRRFAITKKISLHICLFCISIYLYSKNVLQKSTKTICWLFHPDDMDFIWAVRWFTTVYDNVDYFSAKELKGSELTSLKEIRLLKSCTIVTTISIKIKEYFEKFRERVYYVPLGFDEASFKDNDFNHPTKTNLRLRDKPIILFAGGMNFRLNYPLLLQVIKKLRTEFTFVFIGPIQTDQDSLTQNIKTNTKEWINKLEQCPNVFLNRKALPRSQVGKYIKLSTICIVPYDIKQEFNQYCHPMKILEYLYYGKPILSTSIRELAKYQGHIYLGNTPQQWIDHIKLIVKTNPQNEIKKIRKEIAIKNTWQNKVSTIIKAIATNVT